MKHLQLIGFFLLVLAMVTVVNSRKKVDETELIHIRPGPRLVLRFRRNIDAIKKEILTPHNAAAEYPQVKESLVPVKPDPDTEDEYEEGEEEEENDDIDIEPETDNIDEKVEVPSAEARGNPQPELPSIIPGQKSQSGSSINAGQESPLRPSSASLLSSLPQEKEVEQRPLIMTENEINTLDSSGNSQLVDSVNSQLQLEQIQQQQEQLATSNGPIIFTIANTDTHRSWSKLPYREKFQWNDPNAPCYQFDLIIPDERQGHGQVGLCIYRQRLDTLGASGIITHEEDKHVDLFEQREIKVYGHVIDFPGSTVFGRIVETYFYGEISLVDPNGEYYVYVIEEIKLLSKLFHQSRKLFHNIVEVVHNAAGTDPSAIQETQFNAVVTRGGSLLSFLIMSNQNDADSLVPMPVVVLTTHHNSYITPGQPQVIIDELGQMKFVSPGGITVSLVADGSILLETKQKVYTFRPFGATMVKEGVAVTALQEKEGSLAISAVSNALTYGCVLPSHAFAPTRKGGYLCKVCLAADRQFQNTYLQLIGKNDTSTVAFLTDIIDQVSWILRSSDFNSDGHADNVGLDYDAQFSEWHYDDDGRESISEETLEVLFQSLSTLDFSDCCLGIAYTMKKFPSDVYAKASTSTPSEPGGICTLRKDGVSKNVILISAHSKGSDLNITTLTPSQLIYLTAHEIGKAFGSGLDTSGQLGCDTFLDEVTKEPRHYLLWPDVLRGNIGIEEKSFSNCSKKAIVQNLDSCKSSCFEIDLHPFCGNGIQEEGEECDCGNEQSCLKQVCCYGRTGKFPCRRTGLECKTNAATTSLSIGSMFTVSIIFGLFVLLSY